MTRLALAALVTVAMSGCQSLTPGQVAVGCGVARAGAAVGRDVAKGGAVATQAAIGEATDNVCAGLSIATAKP